MAARIAMLLGRSIWTRNANSWRTESFDDEGGLASPAVARLAEILSEVSSGSTILVFEPSGMAHQTVETPKVNRSVFASLAKIRSEHPVVTVENLGWGIEYPEPTPGGTFLTLMHSEPTPGIVHLLEACVRAGSQLSAVWSAYTAMVACVKPRVTAARVWFIMVLVPGFISIASCGGGRRSFKVWETPMSDRDWKAFSTLLGDFGMRPSASMAEAELRRGSIAVIAEGRPEHVCPIWDEISRSGRVESLVDLEAFAASAARIPKRHPANLVEAFPMPRCLDRSLMGVGIAGLLSAMTFGIAVSSQRNQLKAEDAASSARAVALEERLTALNRNRDEMKALRSEAPDRPEFIAAGRYDALLKLAADIPDALTLTSFSIGKDGGFELEAIVVGPDFNPGDVRKALARSGFKMDLNNGWVYDAVSGRLRANGKYEKPRG